MSLFSSLTFKQGPEHTVLVCQLHDDPQSRIRLVMWKDQVLYVNVPPDAEMTEVPSGAHSVRVGSLVLNHTMSDDILQVWSLPYVDGVYDGDQDIEIPVGNKICFKGYNINFTK